MGCDVSDSAAEAWVFPDSTLDMRKQELPRVSGGCARPSHSTVLVFLRCLVVSGNYTKECACTVHVGRFICCLSLTLRPHSLPLSSPSGKNVVWGFQKQDNGPTLNRGQLLSIKLTLSIFSSFYRHTSRASCLFLLFHFGCRMDISLSDGLILSKGLETALLRPFEKLQTLLLFSLSLI